MADKNTMLHIPHKDIGSVCSAYAPKLPSVEDKRMEGIRRRMSISNAVLGSMISAAAILYIAGVSFLYEMSKPAYASKFGDEPAAAQVQYTEKCRGALDSVEEMMESAGSPDTKIGSGARSDLIIAIKDLYPQCEEEIDALVRQNLRQHQQNNLNLFSF